MIRAGRFIIPAILALAISAAQAQDEEVQQSELPPETTEQSAAQDQDIGPAPERDAAQKAIPRVAPAQPHSSDIRLSGFGAMVAGQIVNGASLGQKIAREWQERMFVQLNAEARPAERIRIRLGLEGMLSFSSPFTEEITNVSTLRSRFQVYPHQALGTYRFFGPQDYPVLELGLGYFPFKYNPQSRNLGEYLLRTEIYPNYLPGDFDFAMTRVVGFHLSSSLGGIVRQDLLLTSEIAANPTQDGSLSYLLSVRPLKALEIGGGINLNRVFPIRESRTTPRTGANMYAVTSDTLPDSTVINDSSFYTFKGTKAMGRVCLDPKAFFRAPLLGEEDLKLYAEGAVLGIESYPARLDDSLVAYDNILERMPVMAGFNLPAFRILDVFAVEVEWYRSPYCNGTQPVYEFSIPISDVKEIDTSLAGDIKWSVFLQKKIANHFTVTAQIARDHTQLLNHNSDPRKIRGDVMKSDRDWSWFVKVLYGF